MLKRRRYLAHGYFLPAWIKHYPFVPELSHQLSGVGLYVLTAQILSRAINSNLNRFFLLTISSILYIKSSNPLLSLRQITTFYVKAKQNSTVYYPKHSFITRYIIIRFFLESSGHKLTISQKRSVNRSGNERTRAAVFTYTTARHAHVYCVPDINNDISARLTRCVSMYTVRLNDCFHFSRNCANQFFQV